MAVLVLAGLAVPGAVEAPLAQAATADVATPEGVIAFDRGGAGFSGARDVYVVDPAGAGVQRLTAAAEDDGEPSFSSDATRIVFASCRADALQEAECLLGRVTAAPVDADIWMTIPRAEPAAVPERLTSHPADDTEPDIDLRRNRYVFTSFRDESPAGIGLTSDVYLAALTPDAPAERLTIAPTNDRSAVLSPDGTKVAFVSDRDGDDEIYIMRTAPEGLGNLPVKVTDNLAADQEPTWSPAGDELAFSSNRDGNDEIYAARLSTSGSVTSTRRITNALSSDAEPTFSPDGTSIAFSSTRDGDHDLYVLRAEGESASNPAHQITNDAAPERNPDWVDHVVAGPSTASTPASPGGMRVQDVPLQPQAPVQTSPIPIGDVDIAPIPIGDVDIAPIPIGDVDIAPIGIGDVDIAPIGIGDVDIAPIGIGDVDIAPEAVRDGLSRILASSVTLEGATWEEVVRGTAVEAQPHTVTLLQVLSDPVARDRFLALKLWQVDFASSPIGNATVLAFGLGRTKVGSIAGDWCSTLADFGTCGAELGGTDSSVLFHQLAGAPIGLYGLTSLRMADIGWAADAPFLQVPLYTIQLAAHNWGNVDVGDLGASKSSVVSCSACDDLTLYEAQRDGWLLPTARIAHLMASPKVAGSLFAASLFAVLAASDQPFEEIPLDRLRVGPYEGPAPAKTSVVTFGARVAPVGEPLVDPVVSVDLPSTFSLMARSSTLDGVAIAEPTSTPVDGGFRLTWALEGTTFDPGTSYALSFRAGPGWDLGSQHWSTTITSGAVSETRSGDLGVVETFEPNDSPATAAVIKPEVLYFSHTSPRTGSAPDKDFFKLTVCAGCQVQIWMAPKDGLDRDLVVYGGASTPPLHGVARDSIGLTADEGTSLDGTTGSVHPESSEVPLEPGRPVMAVSAYRGGVTEALHLAVPGSGGDVELLLQVSGYAGAANAAVPYTLRARTLRAAAPCAPRTAPHDAIPSSGTDESVAAGIAPVAADRRTVFLVDYDRIDDSFGPLGRAEVAAALSSPTFLEDPLVKGAVLNVDDVPAVRTAKQALDANPCSIESQNSLVRAIGAAMDGALRDPLTGVVRVPEFVVPIGGHELLPMALLPDLSRGHANERTFPLAAFIGRNGLSTAYQQGYFPADIYGSFSPTATVGGYVYLPDATMGRVNGDTAAEIVQQITRFGSLRTDGSKGSVVPNQTHLVTGYDFMRDVAGLVAGAMGAGTTSLISDVWTLSDWKTALEAKPNIVFNGAHFDESRAAPAAASSGLLTAGYVAGLDLAGAFWQTMGCHSGVPIFDLYPGGKRLDWAQTIPNAGGSGYLAQTGYGLGLGETTAYSEDLLRIFNQHLFSGLLTSGQSLTQAKREYLAQHVMLDAYDYKTIHQAAYFGLPQVHLPNYAPPSVAPPATEVIRTDAQLGLPAVSVTVEPTYRLLDAATGQAYQDGDAPMRVRAHHPLQPQSRVALPQSSDPSLQPRDAIITELSMTYRASNPIVANPVFDRADAERQVESDDLSSTVALQRVATYTGAAGNKISALTWVTGDFAATGRTADRSEVTGIQGLVQRGVSKVLYAPTNPADSSRPTLDVREVERTAEGVSLRLRVTDQSSLATVVAAAEGAEGAWTFVRMTRDPSDPTMYTADVAVAGGSARVIFQAADVNGFVGTATIKDTYAAVPDPAPALPAWSLEWFYPPNRLEMQAGSTLPVKFAVRDENGVALGPEASPVARVVSFAVSCDTGAPIGGPTVEEPLSALSFDASTSRWTYHWSTKKADAGTCRAVQVILDRNDDRYTRWVRLKG